MTGGHYALFAFGLSLSVGIVRLVNLAHGDFIVLAAFLTVALSTGLGIPPMWALVATLPVGFGVMYALQLGTLAVARVALGSIVLLLRSPAGLGLTAMRDNEEAASASGVDIRRLRVLCFLWVAPFLGLIGGLVAVQKLAISPTASFSITDWTVFVIFVVVFGGIGSLEGPIIGTLLYFGARELLSDHGSWHLIALGAASIAILVLEPKGLWGVARRRLGEDLIPITHQPLRKGSRP